MSGNERWAPKGAGPWYDLGIWLVIYGGMVAAPSVAVVLLLWIANLAGVLPLGREFYLLLRVAAVSVPAVLLGAFLVRRESRDLRRLWELERWGW